MRRARSLLLLSLACAGCADFEALLEGRCADGGLSGCPADASTGGGSAGGGSTGGGGGGGPAGGGSSGASDAGGFCHDGWCWEHPLPFGSDLEALWGSSDDEVYAAGGGLLLARWDGRSWRDLQLRVKTWRPAEPLLPMPYWFQSATVGGVTWLLDSEGAVFTWDGQVLVTTSFADVQALTGSGGSISLVQHGTQVRSIAAGGAVTERATVPPNWVVRRIAVDGHRCLLSASSAIDYTPAIIDCDTGAVTALTEGPATGFMHFLDGGWVATGPASQVYRPGGDGGWGTVAIDTTALLTGGIDSPLGPIAFGTGSTLYELERAVGAAPAGSRPMLLSAWYSPSSQQVFGGGVGGEFRRQDDTSTREDRGARVTALYARDDLQVAAVSPGGILVRQDGGFWTPLAHDFGVSWCAVITQGRTVWGLTDIGVLLRFGLDDPGGVVALDAGLAAPPINYLACGAMRASTGGFYVGSGNTVAFVPYDGGAASPPTTLAGDQIVGLAESGGVLWAAANQPSPGHSSVYTLAGTTWSRVWDHPQQGFLGGLAAGPDGGVWVTGSGSTVLLLSSQATRREALDYRTDFVPAEALDVLSRPDGRVWVLFSSGAVLSHQPGTVEWTRESPPWSADPTQSSLEPRSLSATSTHLFVSGSRTTILARELP